MRGVCHSDQGGAEASLPWLPLTVPSVAHHDPREDADQSSGVQGKGQGRKREAQSVLGYQVRGRHCRKDDADRKCATDYQNGILR